jgi:hypothetical protein
MKRTGLIAGLIILALTAGSVITFGKSYANDIYTYDCEYLEQRPEQLTKYCADAGVLIYDITWESWGYNGAEGTGTYSENLCEPNCAEGKRVEAKVDLYLSGIEVIEGKVIVDLNSKGQPYGIEVLDCVVTCISGFKTKGKRKNRK